MTDPLKTRPSLLVRIRDARDREAWHEFVQLYGPVVYQFARKRGLQDADAADLTQEVLQAVANAIGRLDYDPQRGSFRNWLIKVAQNKVCTFLTSPRRQEQGSGDTGIQTLLENQPFPEDDDDAWWEAEYQRRLIARVLERVRSSFQESTWRAFQETALEGKEAKEVAGALGMSIAAVYMAKSRILAELKRQIRQLE